MKIKILAWTLSVLVVAFVLFCAENLFLQKEIADRTLRLHVVANSNSAEDQAHKLILRDTVLQKVNSLCLGCDDAKQAQRVIEEHLPEIESAAEAVSDYDISVHIGKESFDTRYYDTFTLPAGEYMTLRVNIGQAKGKNWWCVVFPSLCTAATSEKVEECAQTAGFDDAQTDLVLGGEDRYILRFKTLEWIRDIFNFF